MVYRIAVAFVVSFTFLHLLSLPFAASYDGMEYVHLANVLGSSAFPEGWNYLRTPLFPAALKLAFAMGGEQPQAAMLVTGVMGLAAVLLTGSTVRYIAGDGAGACALTIVVLYPVSIGYQHMLLSETGIFFFLALLVWLTVRSAHHPTLVAILIAATVAAGYYWRPTLLYLSPVVAIAFTLINRRTPGRRNLLQNAVVILAIPWLLVYPWIRLSSKHPSDIKEVFTTGMYKQVMVPPENPLFGPLGPRYRQIVRDEVGEGHLAPDGLSMVGEGRHEFLKQLHQAYLRAGIGRLVLQYPGRYIAGVLRSFIYFLGVPHHRGDDENWNFSRFVFLAWPQTATFENVPNWIPEYNAQFQPQHYGGGAALGTLLLQLLSLYVPLVLVCSVVSLCWLVVAIRQGNGVVFALTAIPLALIALHALTMMSAGRYAFPIYPLMLANTVTLLGLSCQGWRQKRQL